MIHIDFDRAQTVFARMLALYRSRAHPFVNLENDLPQTIVLPEVQKDPLRFALHLFFSCLYMRGTVVSSHAFAVLNRLQLEAPWLFQLEVVAFVFVAEIEATIGAYIPWQKHDVAISWRNNARILLNEWKGDPRLIFKGVKKKEDLYRRVMGRKYKEYQVNEQGKKVRIPNPHAGFRGFQEKMTSMLAYFLEATGLIAPTTLSAPVDFHHLRVYLATGMIVTPEESVRYEHIKHLGIKLAERLQKKFGLTQVEYGDIVWLWSIRSCRHAPHNASDATIDETGREVRTPVLVKWAPGVIDSHNRTCGRCHVADHCRFGVPAGPYYTTGKFLKVERTEPPQDTLFWPHEVPHLEMPSDDEKDQFLARFIA